MVNRDENMGLITRPYPKVFVKLLLISVIFSLAVYTGCTIVFHNYLYSDGAGYFYTMLKRNGFQLWPQGRILSQILMQAFAVLGMRAGITDVGILGALYGFGVTFWTGLFYVLTFLLLIKTRRYDYLTLLVFWMALSLIFTGFLTQIESIIPVALMTFLFFGILLLSDNEKDLLPNRIALALASLMTIFMNEYFIIWSPILILLIAWKILRKKIHLSSFWFALCIPYLLAMYTAYLGIKNNDPSSVIKSVMLFHRQTDFIVLIFLIAVLIVLSVDFAPLLQRGGKLNKFFNERAKLISVTGVVLQIIVGLFLFLDVLLYHQRIAHNSYALRVINLGMPVLFFFIAVTIDILDVRLKPLWISSGIFLVAMSMYFILSCSAYGAYLKGVVDYCRTHTGFVGMEEAKINSSGYCWGWPVPMESVTAQMIEGYKTIPCIIVSRGGYQPFRTTDIDQYAKFDRFGIIYTGFGRK
jgi:hypothetical protein